MLTNVKLLDELGTPPPVPKSYMLIGTTDNEAFAIKIAEMVWKTLDTHGLKERRSRKKDEKGLDNLGNIFFLYC